MKVGKTKLDGKLKISRLLVQCLTKMLISLVNGSTRSALIVCAQKTNTKDGMLSLLTRPE